MSKINYKEFEYIYGFSSSNYEDKILCIKRINATILSISKELKEIRLSFNSSMLSSDEISQKLHKLKSTASILCCTSIKNYLDELYKTPFTSNNKDFILPLLNKIHHSLDLLMVEYKAIEAFI